MIAKFAELLPLQLDPKAEGYGLVYVHPVNGHYFLVGRASWFPPTTHLRRSPGDRAAPAGAGRGGGAPGAAGFARQDISLGIDFFAPAQRSLTKWGDFILYKDTPANILVQGRFDGNWKLTAADA